MNEYTSILGAFQQNAEATKRFVDKKIDDLPVKKGDGENSTVEGYNTQAYAANAHAEGANTIASGYDSHAEGNSTTAGNQSHAEGYGTYAVTNSHAEGHDTQATNHSHAEGGYSEASGYHSHTEGESTVASGINAHAEGYFTTANGVYSHAEGESTRASGKVSHAEGCCTTASGWSSHAEGDSTTAGDYSHAEGYGSYAVTGSHAEGMGTWARGHGQHVQGKYNLKDSFTNNEPTYAHIVGNGDSDEKRSNAHTLDWKGNAWFAGEIKVGGAGQDDENAKVVATQEYVDLEIAENLKSDFDGYITAGQKKGTTLGEKATAEGFDNEASGQYSHAEGYFTTASGTHSHAEGEHTIAGNCSHAEGYNTQATSYSHAEGYESQANNYSHAEGYQAKATGLYSHAEGYKTTASGKHSHAEGDNTIAGNYSHAEGQNTRAVSSSHAEGVGTHSSKVGQHVQGKYNFNYGTSESPDAGNFAHIIGNGESDAKRSNAHTVDWKGNAWYAGDVFVGNNNKKLATEEYVNEQLSTETSTSRIRVIRVPSAEEGGQPGTIKLEENTVYQFLSGTEKKTLTCYNSDNEVINTLSYQMFTIYCGGMGDNNDLVSDDSLDKRAKQAYLVYVANNTRSDSLLGLPEYDSGHIVFKKNWPDTNQINENFRVEVSYPAGSVIMIQSQEVL